MTSGRPLTRADKLRIWRMVASGDRNVGSVSVRTGYCCRVVVEAIKDACGELMARLDEERRRQDIEDIAGSG